MTDETTGETPDRGDGAARSGPLGAILGRWSRRTTVWVAGATAIVAATGAVAIAATSGDTPASTPSTSPVASNSPLADPAVALDAIIAPNADARQPIATLVKQGKVPKPAYAGDTGTVGVPKNAKAPKRAAAGTVPQFVAGPLSGSLDLVQMAALAMQAGCSADQASIAAAIGAAESAGNPGAQGDISLMDGTWDWSEGLWQIRGLRAERGTGSLRDSLANANPATNAAAMRTISSGCTNWTPWSTYNSGAYLSYLGLSKTAAAAARKFHDQTGKYPTPGTTGGVAAVPVATHSSTSPKTHSSSHKPKPGTSKVSTTRPAPSTSSRSSSTPVPKPSTSTKPKPSTSSKTGPSLPIKLPTSLPVSIPSSLPISIPTKLPTKLPTSLPVSLPITLPTSLPIKLP